ncbi:MAG: GNAT family N-acetyltransferase, partial [Kofleriaceae bacterium]|nr:GNAT family N-acetyltransferase [Kofleriaceae bacterium]
RSPTWFDVSVDTVREYRQLGLASIAAAALLDDEIAQGRQPVWGAIDDNIASHRLAARLGFTAHSRAAMVVPQGAPLGGA